MCGISGILFYSFSQDCNGEKALSNMLDAIRHRGPDNRGEQLIDCGDHAKLFLGHQRLSIIDLSSSGHQPMTNSDRSLWLSYNGEIYNFKEIRNELSDRYNFVSQSDTEVVLKAYEAWGLKCLDKFRGMFAFSLWDGSKKRLILARDRMGIKPLYYCPGQNQFLFSSEIRGISASGLSPFSLNPLGIYDYLSFGRLESPQTMFEEVQELNPGHILVLNLEDRSFNLKEYWNPLSINSSSPSEDSIADIQSVLLDSVRYRMISDVPVGTFLSGGIDSSALTVLLSHLSDQPVQTLSVVFDEKEFDESCYSSLVAKTFGTEHRKLLIGKSDLLGALPGAIASMDQPTVDGINTYLISKRAHEAGLKVVLSGLGGDELFAGYDSFQMLPKLVPWEKALQALPRKFKDIMGYTIQNIFGESDKITKLIHLIKGQYNGSDLYFLFRALFCQTHLSLLFEDSSLVQSGLNKNVKNSLESLKNLQSLSLTEKISWLELKHYMSNMLLKDSDVMSMAHSLELRVPFIDHKLVELMFRIPGYLKTSSRKPKPLLIDSLPAKLPDSIIFRKKMGFTLPFENWMRTHLKKEIEEVLLNPCHRLKGIISETGVQKIWESFLKGHISWSRPWSLYILKKWVFKNL